MALLPGDDKGEQRQAACKLGSSICAKIVSGELDAAQANAARDEELQVAPRPAKKAKVDKKAETESEDEAGEESEESEKQLESDASEDDPPAKASDTEAPANAPEAEATAETSGADATAANAKAAATIFDGGGEQPGDIQPIRRSNQFDADAVIPQKPIDDQGIDGVPTSPTRHAGAICSIEVSLPIAAGSASTAGISAELMDVGAPTAVRSDSHEAISTEPNTTVVGAPTANESDSAARVDAFFEQFMDEPPGLAAPDQWDDIQAEMNYSEFEIW